jgi:mannose-6-phosphate isomerase-like protein (cupin superfamily)
VYANRRNLLLVRPARSYAAYQQRRASNPAQSNYLTINGENSTMTEHARCRRCSVCRVAMSARAPTTSLGFQGFLLLINHTSIYKLFFLYFYNFTPCCAKHTVMVTANQTLDMTPIGMVFHVVKTADDTNGKSLEIEWQLLPNADGTPLHVHPKASESYKVLEGQLEVNINGTWRPLQQGEELTVPPGTPHTFRNPLNSITRVYNIHTPAMHFGEYFEGLNNVVQKLSDGSTAPLKTNFNVATHLSMLMKKYKEEIVSVNPPNFAVSILNIIGKLRGIKI